MGLGLEVVTRPEAERLAELVFDRLLHGRSKLSGSLGSNQLLGSPIGETMEEAFDETASVVERLAGDAAVTEQRTNALFGMLDAANLRMDAIEERQRGLRQEVEDVDVNGRLDRTWKAVEGEAERRLQCHIQIEDLVVRLEALERGARP